MARRRLTAITRPGREIGAALVLKALALALLYLACFDASRRPHISPAAVSERLFAHHSR